MKKIIGHVLSGSLAEGFVIRIDPAIPLDF